MKLATKLDIKWYKTVSDKIRKYLDRQEIVHILEGGYTTDESVELLLNRKDGTKEVIDSVLKGYATIQSEIYDELTDFNKSCTKYTHKEMQIFKDLVKLYAIEVGYGDLDENDDIDFNPERIDE